MGELRDKVLEINEQRKRVYNQIGLEQLSKMEPTTEELDKAVDLCILEGLPVEPLNLAQYISQFRSKGTIDTMDAQKSKALYSLAKLCGNSGLTELKDSFKELLKEYPYSEITYSNLGDLADSI